MAEYTTGTGQDLVKVHEPWWCLGSWCVIHNPMPGPWSDWPTHWRSDVSKMERICPCGVGHPVVESRLHLNDMHGCCGIHRCYATAAERDPDSYIDGEVIERREIEA